MRRNKFTLLLLLMTLLFSQSVLAVPDSVYNQLIISEIRMNHRHRAYIELTNMGDETVDLSNYALQSVEAWEQFYLYPNSTNPEEDTVIFKSGQLGAKKSWRMKGLLEPKQTYVIAPSIDGYLEQMREPAMSIGHVEKADTVICGPDWGLSAIKAYKPEWKMYGLWDKPVAWDTVTYDTTLTLNDTLTDYFGNRIFDFTGDDTTVTDIRKILVVAYEETEMDSVVPYGEFFQFRGQSGLLLLQLYGNLDPEDGTNGTWSDAAKNGVVIVDACNVIVNLDAVPTEPNVGSNQTIGIPVNTARPIAGEITGPHEFTLIRRANVTHGVAHYKAGSSREDSKWLLIPHENERRNIAAWTTVGHHGIATFDVTSAAAGVTITEGANGEPGKIVVPFGTQRHDSVLQVLNIGPGQAWRYIQNSNFEDSLSIMVQDFDTLDFYVVGNDLTQKRFVLEVGPAPDNLAQVFPKATMRYPSVEDEEDLPAIINDYRFGIYVTKPYEAINGIDTIGNVTFGTTIDSLLNALEYPKGAVVEFINESRAFVKDGDKLKVTAVDGVTSKTYYVDVLPYEMGESANLRNISWPEKLPGFVQGWGYTDTIPGFGERTTRYEIEFNPNELNIPALNVEAMDPNAIVVVKRATTLSGTEEERTTTIKVLSEDMESDSVIVKIVFSLANPNKQLYEGDPFFTEFHMRHYWSYEGFEICNPSEKSLDLSQYVIVKSRKASWAEAIEEPLLSDSGSGRWSVANTWDGRYRRYVMGYKYGTPNEWATNPGMLKPDDNVDPIMAARGTKVFYWDAGSNKNDVGHLGRVDVYFNVHQDDFIAGLAKPFDPTPKHPMNNVTAVNLYYNDKYFLLKVTGDSIFEGQKAMTDPNDFEVVDAVGQPGTPLTVAGREMPGSASEFVIRRKPIDYQGWSGPLPGYLHADPDSSHWICFNNVDGGAGSPYDAPVGGRNGATQELGTHDFVLPPVYKSTVVSSKYKVTPGYLPQHNLIISGVSNGEDVTAFLSNIIKEHEDQELTVVDENNNAKSLDALITATDSLIVVSADKSISSKYGVDLTPLLSDVQITSEVYNVSGVADGKAIISGIPQGESLEALRMDNILIPGDYWTDFDATTPSTTVTIIDANGELVPVYTLPAGAVSADEKVATIVDESMTIEVVAENGTKAIYSLELAAASDEAKIYSSLYEVYENEDTLLILNVAGGLTVQTLLMQLTPSTGATMIVYDRLGTERTVGNVLESDYVEVISEDGTTKNKYYLSEDHLPVDRIESIEEATSFSIYPNPTAELINLNNVELGSTISITAITGQVVMTKEIKNSNVISVKHLTKGVYVLTVNDTNQSIQFVIE